MNNLLNFLIRNNWFWIDARKKEEKRFVSRTWTLDCTCVCVLCRDREFLTSFEEHTESDLLIDVHSICSRKSSALRGSGKKR